MLKHVFIGKFETKIDYKLLCDYIKENVLKKCNEIKDEGICDIEENNNCISFNYYYIKPFYGSIYNEELDKIGKNLFQKNNYYIEIFKKNNIIKICSKNEIKIKKIYDFLYKKIDINIYIDEKILSFNNIISRLRKNRLDFYINEIEFEGINIMGIKSKGINIKTYNNNDAYIIVDKINKPLSYISIIIVDKDESTVNINVYINTGNINIEYNSISENFIYDVYDLIDKICY